MGAPRRPKLPEVALAPRRAGPPGLGPARRGLREVRGPAANLSLNRDLKLAAKEAR